MEEIKRNIKLFWASNGKSLLQFLGIVVLVILIIQGLNQYTIAQNKQKAQQKQQNQEQRIQKTTDKSNKEYITKFIEYCNEGKIEEAYKMLSETCKKEKYPTIESFKNNYINKLFTVKRDYNITAEDENYKIAFLEDLLQAGDTENRKQIEDYYKVEDDVLEDKTIYINLYNNI